MVQTGGVTGKGRRWAGAKLGRAGGGRSRGKGQDKRGSRSEQGFQAEEREQRGREVGGGVVEGPNQGGEERRIWRSLAMTSSNQEGGT